LGFLTIDLGTTNIKVSAYSDALQLYAAESEKVVYRQIDDRVEFDAQEYFAKLMSAIGRLVPVMTEATRQIILTGQAESLIVVDQDGIPLRPGISWMDTRSSRECEDLKRFFPEERAYEITGQPTNNPTWPITKILWIKRHEPEIFTHAAKYMLLKDYIQYRLTGRLYGEYSIYNFSYYFDIRKKDYWQEILDWCGVRRNQLPDLVEPCTTIGPLTDDLASQLHFTSVPMINIGTLDHFAGMIGTGNVREGIISESTGTVVTLATLIGEPLFSTERIPCHYGPFSDSYVLLPVCESGGICLEWFKENFAEAFSYQELDDLVASRSSPGDVLFLPYITGTNSPDFNEDAKGVFYGIRLRHDRTDLARGVMEGIAYLLLRNLECLTRIGISADQVITTGGGSKSNVWCQIKADLTRYPFAIPAQSEAASLGCALIGAVSTGLFADYQSAVEKSVSLKKTYDPANPDSYIRLRKLYKVLYEQMLPVFRLDADTN